MVIAGLILMPVHPHIGSGLINAGMTTGMMGINALFNPGVKITQGEFLKAGFAGFVSGLVGSGIQSGFLKIGKTGIMGPIASAAGDMATDAAFQYIMTGKVDGKQVIVSGMTSLVCSEYMRQVATDMNTTAGLKAYANSHAGKTAQRSAGAVADAADGYADDAVRAARNSIGDALDNQADDLATAAKNGIDSTPGGAGVDEVGSNTPDLSTGRGYDAGDAPVRVDGEWSINDMKQGLLGHPPKGLGSPDIHHGGQMPGASKHEIIPSQHRNNSNLHQNKYNQGVTPDMRASDKELHWWYRAREQGADQILPDWIYD